MYIPPDEDGDFLSLRGYPIGERCVRDILEVEWLNDNVSVLNNDTVSYNIFFFLGWQVINFYFHMLMESNSAAVRQVCLSFYQAVVTSVCIRKYNSVSVTMHRNGHEPTYMLFLLSSMKV